MTDDSKALEAAARAMGRAVFGNLAAYEQRQDMFQRWAAAAVRAYLAQREADGAVMVPVEATEEMLLALQKEWQSTGSLRLAYRAMLAARPKPPKDFAGPQRFNT